ncbi:MAG TPA: alpha/beta fold hydrolase [Gaiellaceae bacterium]|nr:alpha/beta fold hydrolase [Gaiellaceae bacterium]HET8651544.1 alpha/beta fold hydrolase [Gaiellaceae bacterium]
MVYPRLRAGLRGGLALALGLLGVVIGVGEAGYYTVKSGPSGDDFTGLLAIPAGLLLLAVGARTLWRSRRTDDNRAWRYVRRALLALGAALLVAFVMFPLSLSYVVTHVARAYVPEPDLGAPYEDVSFETSDGLTLRGWYVPSKNRAAVIAFPGRKGPQAPARMLARHGYGVLLFDRRGEGESDGDPNTFGWSGELDVYAAAAFLRSRPEVDPERIGAVGLSVGGEMLIQAAAESDEVKAIVSEGAGARSIREDLELPDASWYSPGIWLAGVITAGTALFSDKLPPPNLKELASRISPRSVFFVYGEEGQPQEIDLNPVYYAAARRPKAIWEVPGAGHTGGIDAQPDEYERRVVAFFDGALAP